MKTVLSTQNLPELLQVKDNFSFHPQLLQAIVIAPIWGKEMYNHAAIIGQHPTGFGIAFDAGSNIVLRAQLSLHGTRQSIQHAVTGSGTDHKIIRDGGYFADI